MTPDVVEYDKRKMTKPAFNLILGCQTMKELGIVLDFQTKEITIDHIILSMREINGLTPSNLDRSWAVNNSMAHEPQSMQEATQCVVKILDANYKKANLQQVLAPIVLTLVSRTKTRCWSCSQNLRNFLTEH